MSIEVLSTDAFYTRVAQYMQRVDPRWETDRWHIQRAKGLATLPDALGEAGGQTVLDCTCGTGGQAIPLALLGWHVTATDIMEAALSTARKYAAMEYANIRVPTACATKGRTDAFPGNCWVYRHRIASATLPMASVCRSRT